MRGLRPLCCLTALLLATGWPTDVRAQLANRKETLRGHRTIYLSISTPETDDAVRQLGLKQESLQRYVVQRLQESRIEVSTEYTDQTLILEIQVDLLKVIQSDDVDVFAFISQFEAIQLARLATPGQAALVTTWRSTKFGAVTPAQAGLLRDSVLQNLERFITDYLEVQTKTEGTSHEP